MWGISTCSVNRVGVGIIRAVEQSRTGKDVLLLEEAFKKFSAGLRVLFWACFSCRDNLGARCYNNRPRTRPKHVCQAPNFRSKVYLGAWDGGGGYFLSAKFLSFFYPELFRTGAGERSSHVPTLLHSCCAVALHLLFFQLS